MKNLLIIALIAILASCTAPAPVETEVIVEVDRAVGFNTMLPELQWHIGTEDAIQIVKDLDKVWAAEDYDGMTGFFADTCKFFFPDGHIATSPAGFIEKIKAEDMGDDDSWTFDYAYSVDLDPSQGGEHVQAGFTGTAMKDGVEVKKRYHESYYIIDGKIVMWNQFTMKIAGEKKD